MRLLDLFCGAGGAAKGYSDAGFDVFGVDIEWQPHYPFEMAVGNALTLGPEIWYEFDAVHASPPCQAYSRMRHLPWLRGKNYPRLIEPMIELLEASGLPYVLENVEDAKSVLPMAPWLCGTMFGESFYRHRLFANNWRLIPPVHRSHRFVIRPGRMFGDAGDLANAREAHCWPWMTKKEQRQAIPPAYTYYIGERLMEYLT